MYVDWTCENNSRPFYVGKGTGRRIKVSRRNWSHKKIRDCFGFERKIHFFTANEDEAFVMEEKLIAEYGTFVNSPNYNGIGCNFTGGGSGGRCPSAETRRKIGESNKRRRGEKRSEVARKRISKGIHDSLEKNGCRSPHTEEHRKHISQGLRGHLVRDETRAKLRDATRQMHQDPVIKQRVLQALRNAISKSVLEIDPSTEIVIREHQTTNAAAACAGIGVKYLRTALRNNDQEFLLRKTGRKWKYKTSA